MFIAFICPAVLVDPPDALLLCKMLPGVHHVELNQLDFMEFFKPCLDTTDPTENLYPIDLWNDLESLSLWKPDTEWTKGLDDLLGWLTCRWKSGLPPLHVKLTGFPIDKPLEAMLDYSLRIYSGLKVYCVLEFDMPVEVQPRVAVEADAVLQLVSALPHKIDERFSLVLSL